MSVTARTPRRLVRGAIALVCLLASAVSAADPMIITSATKQFVVRGLPQSSMLKARAGGELVYLEPGLLAVTCETVKRTLQRELGWGERWSGAVYINIHPIRFDNETVQVRVSRDEGRWRYHMEIPDEISRRELIRGLIEVLLVEFADRAAMQESVELPPWLADGLAEHLLQGPLANAALQARTLDELRADPTLLATKTTRPVDVDKRLRQIVQREGALTFDQLSWTEFDENDSQMAVRYRFSSHLFVRELLRLRGGPDCICAMLAMLPEHLNWQMAFLRGFTPYFQRLLDVEKWWSMSLVQWKTHDSSVVWSPVEAGKKMDEFLGAPVQMHSGRENASLVAPMKLQTVIKDWPFPDQVPWLKSRIGQLQAARLHLPPAFGALADSYRVVLEKYLQARSGAWFEASGRAVASRAIAELDTLDAQRVQLPGKIVAARSGEPAPLTPP